MTVNQRDRMVVSVEPFTAMGVTCRLTFVDPVDGAAEVARARIAQLESRWSRFRPESDISRLNSAGGSWTAVSSDTLVLLRFMQQAHLATGGAFNPTLLPDTVRLGDRSSRTDHHPLALPGTAHRHPDLASVDLDGAIAGARIPADMALDAGGIGKGLAADIVAEEAISAGSGGVCINIGGDLRCAGTPPSPHGWRVDVRSARDFESIESTVWLEHGAVATSTPAARTWNVDGEDRHHIIDPTAGLPVRRGGSRLELASVVAAHGAWAEVFTKAMLVLGWDEGSALASRHSLAVFGVDGEGRHLASPSWEIFAR